MPKSASKPSLTASSNAARRRPRPHRAGEEVAERRRAPSAERAIQATARLASRSGGAPGDLGGRGRPTRAQGRESARGGCRSSPTPRRRRAGRDACGSGSPPERCERAQSRPRRRPTRRARALRAARHARPPRGSSHRALLGRGRVERQRPHPIGVAEPEARGLRGDTRSRRVGCFDLERPLSDPLQPGDVRARVERQREAPERGPDVRGQLRSRGFATQRGSSASRRGGRSSRSARHAPASRASRAASPRGPPRSRPRRPR